MIKSKLSVKMQLDVEVSLPASFIVRLVYVRRELASICLQNTRTYNFLP